MWKMSQNCRGVAGASAVLLSCLLNVEMNTRGFKLAVGRKQNFKLEMTQYFQKYRRILRMMSPSKWYISVSIVAVDGLASLGAKISSGTMMAKFGFLIHTGPALEGISHQICTWWRVVLLSHVVPLLTPGDALNQSDYIPQDCFTGTMELYGCKIALIQCCLIYFHTKVYKILRHANKETGSEAYLMLTKVADASLQ